MRVALLHSQSRERGGADVVMEDQATMLRAAGHEVRELLYPGVPPAPSPMHAFEMVWNQDAYAKVKRLADSFKPDIVHVHAPYPRLSPAVFRAAVEQGAATVTTLHNYRPACPIGTFYRDGKICTECLGQRVKISAIRHACYHDSRKASAAMVASIALHRRTWTTYVHRYLAFTVFGAELLAQEGLPRQIIGVCPNTVPPARNIAVRGNRARAVLFSGRLVPEKGISTLLDAWALVPHDVKLLVAGDGPLLGTVREAAARDSRVEVLGWVDRQRLTNLYEEADLLVFPSLWHEGQPLTILEAMAHSLPSVCSDLPAIAETAAAHDVGQVFQAGSPTDLARTLTSALSDVRDLRRRGTLAQRHHAAHHAPDQGVVDLVHHYKLAMERKGRVRR